MRDSKWWQPMLFGFFLFSCMGFEFIKRSDLATKMLAASFAVLFLAFIFVGRANDRRAAQWTKPFARVLDGETLLISGDCRELQRLGVPGARLWEHVGYKKWKLKVNGDPRDAATLINGWHK